jgi:hypothetical protein
MTSPAQTMTTAIPERALIVFIAFIAFIRIFAVSHSSCSHRRRAVIARS